MPLNRSFRDNVDAAVSVLEGRTPAMFAPDPNASMLRTFHRSGEFSVEFSSLENNGVAPGFAA